MTIENKNVVKYSITNNDYNNDCYIVEDSENDNNDNHNNEKDRYSKYYMNK